MSDSRSESLPKRDRPFPLAIVGMGCRFPGGSDDVKSFWKMLVEGRSGIQETPIAIDGMVYSITANNRVAAIDGETGQEIWRFEPKPEPDLKGQWITEIHETLIYRGLC